MYGCPRGVNDADGCQKQNLERVWQMHSNSLRPTSNSCRMICLLGIKGHPRPIELILWWEVGRSTPKCTGQISNVVQIYCSFCVWEWMYSPSSGHDHSLESLWEGMRRIVPRANWDIFMKCDAQKGSTGQLHFAIWNPVGLGFITAFMNSMA